MLFAEHIYLMNSFAFPSQNTGKAWLYAIPKINIKNTCELSWLSLCNIENLTALFMYCANDVILSLFYENCDTRFFCLHGLALFTDRITLCSLARLQPYISHEKSLVVKINSHPVTRDEKLWASRDCWLLYSQDSLCFCVEGGHKLSYPLTSVCDSNLSEE